MDCTTPDTRLSICPGKDLGDASVWLAAVSMLAVFYIRKARDSGGREVTPIPSFGSGMIRYVSHTLAAGRDSLPVITVMYARSFATSVRDRRRWPK